MRTTRPHRWIWKIMVCHPIHLWESYLNRLDLSIDTIDVMVEREFIFWLITFFFGTVLTMTDSQRLAGACKCAVFAVLLHLFLPNLSCCHMSRSQTLKFKLNNVASANFINSITLDAAFVSSCNHL
jgi:hypothetical protein